MKKLIPFAILLICSIAAAKDYARRYPTDTALEVYTPGNPQPAPDLSGYVPYTGATQELNTGSQPIRTAGTVYAAEGVNMLGPEILTDPGFNATIEASPGTDRVWISTGTTPAPSISGGVLTMAGSMSTVRQRVAETIVPGVTYIVQVQGINGTFGGGTSTSISVGGVSYDLSANGTYNLPGFTAVNTNQMVITSGGAPMTMQGISLSRVGNMTVGQQTVASTLTVQGTTTFQNPVTVSSGLLTTKEITSAATTANMNNSGKGFSFTCSNGNSNGAGGGFTVQGGSQAGSGGYAEAGSFTFYTYESGPYAVPAGLRWGYNASNRAESYVSTTGAVTFDAKGTSASFNFKDSVSVPTFLAFVYDDEVVSYDDDIVMDNNT